MDNCMKIMMVTLLAVVIVYIIGMVTNITYIREQVNTVNTQLTVIQRDIRNISTNIKDQTLIPDPIEGGQNGSTQEGL